MSNGVSFSRDDLLALWESRWGTLDEEWRRRFLDDDRLSVILLYRGTWVRPAVRQHKKLDEIIASLERRQSEAKAKPKQPARKTQTKKQPPQSQRRKKPKPKSTGRSTGQTGGRREGTPGYYRMPRSRKPEKPAGVCPACGVKYGYDGRCACS